MSDLTWRQAIEKVLAESGEAMHYTKIADTILRQGLLETNGATPAASVNSQISGSLNVEKADSPFIRVAPGMYALKSSLEKEEPPPITANAGMVDDPDVLSASAHVESTATATLQTPVSQSIVQSFGMYWRRDVVIWKAHPSLLGAQEGAEAVDFGRQKGIYVLYDQHTPIYVGKSIGLGQRLFDHTKDRFASRWNAFSWFGLMRVTEIGSLEDVSFVPSADRMIATLEAVMIEAMEPPLNRRRGDDLETFEYYQIVDPAIKKKQMKALLNEVTSLFDAQPGN